MQQQGGITGRHVLLGLIAFFAIIFAVNGVFLYQALSTHTGVVSNEPYRKGLAYNERIAADQEQQTLGWHVDLAVPEKAGELRLALADPNGRPVPGLVITGRLGRPSTGDLDQTLALEEKTPGTYATNIAALQEGTWVIDLQASEMKSAGEAIVWRLRKRLWQKP